MDHYNKYSALKSWKKFLWAITVCYGIYCLTLVIDTLLQTVPENVAAWNEMNLPFYILLGVMILHSISISVIYKTLSSD